MSVIRHYKTRPGLRRPAFFVARNNTNNQLQLLSRWRPLEPGEWRIISSSAGLVSALRKGGRVTLWCEPCHAVARRQWRLHRWLFGEHKCEHLPTLIAEQVPQVLLSNLATGGLGVLGIEGPEPGPGLRELRRRRAEVAALGFGDGERAAPGPLVPKEDGDAEKP